jgi:hypothetical protein
MRVGLASVLMIAGAFAPTLAISQGAATTARQPASKADRTKELESAARKLALVLENGSPEELPALLSYEGVAFGTDSPPTSLSEIRQEIGHRDRLYCELFDTRCLRTEAQRYGENVTLYDSLRQRIASTSTWSIRASRVSADRGTAVLELRQITRSNYGTVVIENDVFFFFGWEEGEWKLRSLSVPGLF